QAYASVEWWAKDWSSHKDWGTSVITELNAMIKDANNNDPMIVKDRDIFKGQEVTQENYIQSAKLQDLAAFYKNNFNLGLRTPYGDMLTHGLLPIKGDDVVITYKDKEYKGKAIFDVLKLLSDEIKEATDTGSMRDALDLVNSWYADATTIAKPKNVKDLLGKIAAVVSKLGVRIWAMGHNPVNKVKAPVISTDAKDNRFSIVQLDFGMAPKFGGAGAYAAFGANGIVVKGFETDKTDEAIKVSPDTIIAAKKEGEKPTVIKNPGMPAKAYLENTKAALEEELKGLPVLQKAALTIEAQAQAQFVQDLAGIVEVTPTEVKVLDKGLFLAKGVSVLANAAALSPSADVKTAAKRIVLEILPQFGIKAASDHEFYMAKQQGKWKNITVPAVNGRSTVFMSFRPMFRVAKEENVGVIKTEVARSEMRYSAQDSAEIVAITGLAAIAEGWTGLLFVQQDHNQIDKDKYKKGGEERQKEIDARNKLFREGIIAGQYNIDLDPSTLVDEDALAEIIKIEGELVAQYQAKHPELLKGIENDDKAMGSLRRRLVDEIEMGDIEDKDFLAQADVVAKINRLATELYPQMHKLSIEATMNDIRTIRKLEKEMGLTQSTSIGIEERHIDNKVHKDFPSTVLGSITLSQSILKLARAEGLVAHSKISLQTGAMHGLGGTVDFGIYERHVRHADKIGVAVFVQHGASTLAKHDFDKMRDGDVGEVHLATEYQKIVFSIVAQEYPELAEKMAQWLEAKMANEQKFKDKYQAFWDAAMAQPGKDRATVIAEILGDSSNLPKDLKGKFKDLVKELSAPFKSELWNLPENVADKIDSALYEEFKLIFGKLGVVNTKDLIEEIMPYDKYPVELTPRPAAVATVFAQTMTVSPEEQFVQDLAGIVEVTPTEVKVLDKGLFLAKGVSVLANAAALSPSADVKTAAKRIVLEILPQFGIKAASDHEFYMAKQQGKWKNITVPAVNGRSTVFMSFRPMFRVAKEENVGVIKTEVARSEMRYSAQDSAEIVAITGLAAIAEGWTGLLFVQQDHNQIDKDKYKKGGEERQKEIDARNKLFREGIIAGQYNIDLDPSTLVDEDALAEIIKIEGELVAQYQAKHPELLKGIENDDKAMGSLRRRLVDEIEMGDIEDKDFLAQADVVAKINRLATELYPQMHKLSIEATMNDIRTIRKLEKEMGLTQSTSIGIEERHIDNKVHKDFPSTVLGSITLSQSILKLARAEGLVAHSKISLQTGAMHGLGGTVDFGIYERHVRHADKIGVAVFVQHGASTLAKHDFDKMRDGDVGEVHLATEYQKIVFSIVAQEYPELAEKMAQWLEAKMANEQKFKDKYQAFWDAAMAQPGKDRATVIAEILGDSSNLPKDLKGKFKDLVKELSAPFKSELWNLPENVADKIDSALYEEFKLIFGKLGVVNTKDLIEKIMPYDAYPVELTPRPAAVATVFAKKAAFDSAVVVDPVLVTAGGVTEILKTVAGMQNKAIVFYGPAAQAMKILAKGSSNILTADNEVAAVEQLIKDKGISPAKIRLVTTELKESVKSTGITQKIVSAEDPVGIMFALAKAETENTPVPEAADAFAKLYAAVEKSGVIPVDATARDKILAVAKMVAETVEMKSNVQVTEDQKKVIEQILTKIGV
ncbi:MAG TPA: hypothetical protein PKL03_05130, partial [Candidatus Omnitrophota bacterium]|nr:hypothetical protein [Candidatus Omnitrophota bacterium]